MRTALAAVLGVALALAGGATGAVSGSGKRPAAVPGELIVGFKAGVSEGAQQAALTRAGAKDKKSFKQIHARLVGVAENKVDAVAKALSSDPRVAYVEPNHVVSIDAVPNDPSFGQLWGLNNTGQTGGTADADVDAPEAWNVETGSSSVVVAVTDTGVDFGHPDLAAQQWINPGENCGFSDPNVLCDQRSNTVDDDGDGYVDDFRGWDYVSNDNNPVDDHNHGTHVSGTIGAVGNNGIGVAGLNWNVKVMALKFLDSTGNGNTANAISATLYAADHGARVASNSWGGGPFDQGLLDAIEYGASKGMLFVAAAGNDSSNNDTTPSYPASYDSPALVAVAATDHNDALASFSNYGAAGVDLAAPGVNILSTTRGGTYSTFSGTSMATPHVSGAAALVKAHVPGATLYGLKAVLMGSVDTKPSLSGKVVTNGRLNVFNALSCADKPEVLVNAPDNGFTVGVGDNVPVKLVGANCALPAGLPNVTVTVNGAPVALTAASRDSGFYTGSFTPTAEGPLSVAATVQAGGASTTRTLNGSAVRNYSCQDVSDPWVDATPGTKLTTASNSDDGFSTLNISFPFTFYGQTYTTTYVSSNGFLTLGSSSGADAYLGTRLPDADPPNGVVAPFWDDLDPSFAGDVYAGVSGTTGNSVLHVEWYNVPHFFGDNGATFEVSLYEATGKIVYRWLDTNLGDTGWNNGVSATAGLENAAGAIGRQLGYNQPVLTSGRAVSCLPADTAPPAAPSITTTSLADATNTASYSAGLAAAGGTPPYTWSLASGALPSGLALNPSTGAITGTPAEVPGHYAFTVRVTDAASQSGTKPLSIDVADPLAVTTSGFPDGTVGQSYSQTLAATGGKTPYTWSVASGSLPSGLALSSSTGQISGSPGSAGQFDFRVQATDAGNPVRTASADLSITVFSALAITTANLPGGTVGSAYSQTLTATGGKTPYAWSVASGSLPSGLTLSSSTGEISGSPDSPGQFNFTVQATDTGNPARTASADLSITVFSALAITTTSLPDGTVGSAYSQTLIATGGKTPYTWSVAGSLPPGLTLGTSTGTISGTPTTAGTYTFTAQVDDGAQTDTQELSITVAPNPTLTITTASTLPAGRVGSPYTTTLAATGGVGAYTWARASGSLPPGLSLGPSTGTITGTPTKQGNYTFTVRVTDGAGNTATKVFTLKINRR